MKIFFTLVVLVVVYYSYPVYKSLRMSAEIEGNTVPFEQHPENPTMRILVTGDSTAVGTGASRSEDSTAGRLGAIYPNADIENISENGLKIGELETKLRYLQGKYDLIVIQIGANDIVRFTRLSFIEKKLDLILKNVTGRSEKVVVITSGNIGLAPLFKKPLSNLISNRTWHVRNIFMNRVREYPNALYADLYKEREDDIFIKDIERYYAKDHFHPSSDGYKVWFSAIIEA